jgi:hypothetical protein
MGQEMRTSQKATPAILIFLFLGVLLVSSCRDEAAPGYSPQVGDILFQSVPRNDLVDAIEGITQSPYSHCGVVNRIGGEWYVIEAIGPVKQTPLAAFIGRSRNRVLDAYRLKAEYTGGIHGFIQQLRTYLGKPYDLRYRLDDEQIYCSELVYKAFTEQYGEPLGELKELGNMNWQPYERTIIKYEGGPVPLTRKMITPEAIAASTRLALIYSKEGKEALGRLPSN